MSSDAYNCEALMITALQAQTDLAALNTAGGIVHFDVSTQTSASTIDRIVVKAAEPTVQVLSSDGSTPKIWSCMVDVTIFMATNNPTLLDTYIAAVMAANTGTTPAAVTTQATSLFGTGRGFRWFETEQRTRDDTDNERQVTMTWNAWFGA